MIEMLDALNDAIERKAVGDRLALALQKIMPEHEATKVAQLILGIDRKLDDILARLPEVAS